MKSIDLHSVVLSKYQKGITPLKIINHLNSSVGFCDGANISRRKVLLTYVTLIRIKLANWAQNKF